MEAPFAAEIRDGKLFGRGSQDMKGSLAAMLAAAKALVEAGVQLKGDLILAGVCDEEYASLGTMALVKAFRTEAAIVTEPTDLKLALAHRGFIVYDIHTSGRAAHGSRYNEGIDAILHMGRVLGELERLERELRERAPHPLVGPPSLHASTIQGGTEMSTYPAHCHLQVERRTCPGETLAGATAEVEQILERLGRSDPAFKATLTPMLWRAPHEASAEAEVARAVEAAMSQRLGRRPEQAGVSFWTDAAILGEAGIQAVLLGPKGGGLHSAVEWVELASLVELAEILAAAAMQYGGPGS
jgi:acetylornithine deacetylase